MLFLSRLRHLKIISQPKLIKLNLNVYYYQIQEVKHRKNLSKNPILYLKFLKAKISIIKIEISLFLQVLFIRDHGKINNGMVLVFKFGQIKQDIRVNGKIIKLMGKENLFILKGIYIRVSGKMIKPMVKVHTFT